MSLLACAPAQAQFNLFYTVDGFAKSEIAPLKYTAKGLEKGFKSGKTLYLSAQAEHGFRLDNFKFSLLYRRDYAAWFNEDTAKFYRAIRNKKVYFDQKEYQIDLQAEAMYSSGIKLGYQYDFQNQSYLAADVSLLEVRYLEDINLQGTGYAKSRKSYDFILQAKQQYTEDLLFGREVDKVYGYGATLDLYGSWHIASNWQVSFFAKDLLSYIKWNKLAYTDAIASDKNSDTDEDGYITWDPSISGTESYYPNATVKLRQRFNIENRYSYGNWQAAIAGQYMAKDFLGSVGFGYQSESTLYQVFYWPENKAYELSLKHKHFSFALAADGGTDAAQLLKISLGFYL